MSEVALIREIEALKRRAADLERIEPRPIACRVYNDATLSHTSTGNWLPLAMNAERWDTSGMHSTSVSNSYITFALAGWYMVGGNMVFAANATGARGAAIRLGGATYIAMNTQTNNGAGTAVHMSVSTLYFFAATNYVELMGFQDSGGNLNITASTNYSPEFWAIRLP